MTVSLSQPRRTARITFPDGRVFSAPVGTSLCDYVAAAGASGRPQAVAAIVDGKLTELGRAVVRDGAAAPVCVDTADGARIYRRSLTFLLIAVANRYAPDARVYVEHSISAGGYYCRVEGRPPLSDAEVEALEQRMREIVAADLPIERMEMRLDEAMALFEAAGDTEKLELLKQRQKPTLIVYRLLDTQDYFHGYMTPSTGYLRHFALQPADAGFVLRYPRQATPTEIVRLAASPPILDVFTEYSDWLHALGIRNVAGLNAALAEGRLTELILVTEALHEQRISNIADLIARQADRMRLVLVAGPSASGKTTFARRLAVRLLALDLRPLAISLDDYFVDRQHTPRDEHGEYDFESLHTVDLPLLNRQLNQLIAGQPVQLPHYDFRRGERVAGPTVQVMPHHVLILEGIHALNAALVPDVDPAVCFRIYASALTQLNLDRYNRVSTTDTRLIRRIVRDARNRGYSAADTIGRWESVRRGERAWIFPYQDNADVMVNSALTYELSILKPLVEPLLLQIEPRTVARIEADRLLALLRWFRPAESENVPSDSILREFIGGSVLETYRPWPLMNDQAGA